MIQWMTMMESEEVPWWAPEGTTGSWQWSEELWWTAAWGFHSSAPAPLALHPWVRLRASLQNYMHANWSYSSVHKILATTKENKSDNIRHYSSVSSQTQATHRGLNMQVCFAVCLLTIYFHSRWTIWQAALMKYTRIGDFPLSSVDLCLGLYFAAWCVASAAWLPVASEQTEMFGVDAWCSDNLQEMNPPMRHTQQLSIHTVQLQYTQWEELMEIHQFIIQMAAFTRYYCLNT